ncbi:MAG: VWA domain-containing protein [Chiayiivirga sp.]|jgi:Ca-activated chloride channel family protein|uniref:VWA domain-containing protein n=1 Tax=Chiayiivirga sp. TaxID=2041042 RepID=UPI0025C64E08|nr:VWA domain-containing protein [Chiayiivirga sp.]MCI1710597.1 VWA domain-containing protein [Chiayiivirga sp.]MCI1728568.1 VWA domain-containing protein [Chiayiivirga sp.]
MTQALAEFHFLRPYWLLVLLALPLLAWLWQRGRDLDQPWRNVCDPHLLAQLLQPGAAAQRRWPMLLAGSGLVLAVLALAGPAFQRLPQAMSRAESALIVAVDLSDRMRATDLKPDRLGRARYKISDLLRQRTEGQTALLAYSGDAFVVAPLTDDAASLSDLLAALTPETLPVPGQRADRAIARGRTLLRDAGFAQGDLLLVTDHVEARDADAAQEAAAEGLRVSVLGVGTETGAPVPLPQGGFAQDSNGNVLLPRLDEAQLRDLAAAGGGRYARLASDASDLAALALSGEGADGDHYRADERTRADYRDEGPWLLLLLLPLAALAFRRGWLACLPLALCLHAPHADAFEWSSLWQRDDQRAYSALREQDATRALQLARDPALRGSAAFRAEDYEQAEQAYAQAKDSDALYNRGNALAKAQRYEDALKSYDQALAQAPGMEDAQFNRKAVEDWLRQQQEQQQEQQQQQQQPQSGEQDDPQQPPSQDQQQPSSQPQDQSESQQGESRQPDSSSGEDEARQDRAEPDAAQQEQAQQQFSEQMEQALKEGEKDGEKTGAESMDPREMEKQQAVEQWLRRVPDDPGGLLRRKFALEYQRRRREGDAE